MINFIGLLFVALLLLPNLLFAVTHKDGFENLYRNKPVEVCEQIGRFGCFLFAWIEIPYLSRGELFAGAKIVYLIAGGVLVALYLLGWAVFWRESSLRKALALSILPSLLFLESGILTQNFPLLLFSLFFAPCHILISAKNATAAKRK